MPDLTFERAVGGVVAGIDEAGRGPWAGPVVAAAVVLDLACLPPELARRLDDSKRLSPARREACFAELGFCAAIGVGAASVAEIDTLNILRATLLAMARAFAKLGVPVDHVLVDGNKAPSLPCAVTTVIGGDGKSLSIAAASIVAKVIRDRLMTDLAQAFPGYGWERNKGYGTALHGAALERLGVTPHHRRSFEPVAACLCRLR
ncbi:MAG: ribonuclease HII [Alphaproteobacteria bacterium]|nr:ribonuclease HII [Alphaproteobacteria bacterium]